VPRFAPVSCILRLVTPVLRALTWASPYSEGDHTVRALYVEPGVQIDFVQDLKEKYDTAQGDDKTHKNKQLFWTKVAAGLLLLTAGFTGWQGYSTKKAADAATSAANTANITLKDGQQRFRMEQRPYIWANPKAGNSRGVVIGSPKKDGVYVVDIAVDIKNGGRSPAIHMITTKSEIIIGPTEEAAKMAKEYIPQYGESPGLILATDATDTTVTESCANAVKRLTSENKPVRFTCSTQYQSPILTRKQVDRLMDYSWTVYVVGGVRYTDTFQPPLTQPYETTFCFGVKPTGLAFGNCTFGNSMK
jgi:hypothetical protein